MTPRQRARLGIAMLGLVLAGHGEMGLSDNLLHEAPIATARWSLDTANRVVCRLQQVIPGVGRVLFEQRAGESLLFALQGNQRADAIAGAELRLLAPAWRHDVIRQTPLPLHAFTVEGDTWLGVRGDDAWRMYQALQRGQQPTFVLQARDTPDVPRQIGVSPVRFAEALDAFDDCRANLLPFRFDALNDRTLYFDPEQRKPSTLDADWLRDTTAYLKAVPESQVWIYSALTAQGVNDGSPWFQRRAQALADLWRRQGVAAKRIHIRAKPPADSTPNRLRVAVFGPEVLTQLALTNKRGATLSAAERRRLALLAEYLKTHYRGKLVIDSFVARHGDKRQSLALAEQRAAALREALVQAGIPARRIEIQTRAKTLPMRKTGEGREIKYHKPPEAHRLAIKWQPD